MSVLETTDTKAPVLVRTDGPAARITLNRPDQRNALSLEVLGEVTAALRRLGEDREVRAIVVEGAGPAFSAGHDFREMVGRDLAFYQRLFDACQEMMETIHAVPQPVMARVHAAAAAAGCQLVAACDLAVAADTARFSTPGVRNGIFCSTPRWRPWSTRSPCRAASSSGSASARSTTRSTSTSAAPTTTWER